MWKPIQVKNCCCGCSLELGAKIIAYCELVTSLLVLILYVAYTELVFDDNEAKNEDSISWRFSWVAEIILIILQIAVSIILLVAIKKQKPKLITFWIWFSIIDMGLDIIYITEKLIQEILGHHTEDVIETVVIELVLFPLSVYCLIVVYSLKVKMTQPQIIVYNKFENPQVNTERKPLEHIQVVEHDSTAENP